MRPETDVGQQNGVYISAPLAMKGDARYNTIAPFHSSVWPGLKEQLSSAHTKKLSITCYENNGFARGLHRSERPENSRWRSAHKPVRDDQPAVRFLRPDQLAAKSGTDD